MLSEQLTFTIPEIFSLIGLAQCLYVLVYMMFRSGDPKRAAIPFVYFFVLAIAFFLDFAKRYIGGYWDGYFILQWGFWFYGPPLSVLLLMQVAQINRMPSLSNYWVLLLIPAAFGLSYGSSITSLSCQGVVIHCEIFSDWLVLTGLLAGVISMLAIWSLRYVMHDLYSLKEGQARYWLVITLVMINLMFLATMLLGMTPYLMEMDVLLIKTILGIAFVYLAGTSLFRIYPQALILVARVKRMAAMTGEEKELAEKIESLLSLEKIYHEPAYGRKDLARELDVSETIVSRVINIHFGKNFPQLLNEKRVEDAQRLLVETQESMKVVCEEVGFNSLASFNRAFREITGISPSEFREQNQQQIQASL